MATSGTTGHPGSVSSGPGSELIEPFNIDVPEGELLDLRRRLLATRWPEPATVTDWSQGVPLSYLQDVCTYWAHSYDWPRRQAMLNAYRQFSTQIDGLGIHFVHVRSPERNAVPLILTHGWPGSFIEYVGVIGELTDPRAHGGDPADAFDVVIPSLPGFGWSDKPATSGWGIERIAEAWATIMTRLGYDRYGATGGDWGSGVTLCLARQHPESLSGIHLSTQGLIREDPGQTEFDAGELSAMAARERYGRVESGYMWQQSTRPQTIGYGLCDSPAGQCAWILEKFASWSDCDGDPIGAFGADRVLDNVMAYWLTASGASAARIYWESTQAMAAGFGRIEAPFGASVFPNDIFQSRRAWAERAFADVRYWNELDSGGHFGAFERPHAFADEIKAFFRLVR